ncbi:hypothetical protein MBLNU13_g10359t1 [Cladosporium sp. NU13]
MVDAPDTATVFYVVGVDAATGALLAILQYSMIASGKEIGGLFPLTTPKFDAEAQRVNTTGEHAWKAPGKSTQRGPCPGLNALANHRYLPHNGSGTIDHFIDSVMKVYGISLDFATFLAVYPSVTSGDLLSFSIGGPGSRVSKLGLLGQPQGLSGLHKKFEGDSSPTRGDLYLTGNNFDLDMERFQQLYDAGKKKDNYDLQLLTDQRYAQCQASIRENPYFVNAPFSGIVANAAARCLVYRLMSNKTEEHPHGVLNGDILKTFCAVTGEDGNFQYKRGHEHIPDNWYTRNAEDQYSISFLISDDLEMVLQHLDLDSIGGNTGTMDSFTGVDFAHLNGGVFNAETLLEDNNLFCFAMARNSSSIDKLGSVLNKATNSLGFPKLNNISKKAFDNYPGLTKEYKGYTPVAKLLGML